MNDIDSEVMLQDWLRLVDFGDKAVKYTKDTGQVLNVTDLARQPGGKEGVGSYKRLSDLSDFRMFSLGPIYTHCNVPFDIIGEFRADMEKGGERYDGPRIVLEFKSSVIEGLGDWSHIVEGIWSGPTGYDKLVKYMTSQNIRQKDSRQFWTFKYVELAIPDPMAVDRHEYDPFDPSKRAVVGVFLPSGNTYQVVNAPCLDYPPIKLYRCTPDEKMVKEGLIALSVGA